MDFASFFNDFFATTGITLIKVFAIIIFGILLIKIIMRYTKRAFMASSMEAGLTSFLLSVIRAVLYILLLFLVLSTLGVSMAAFIAALSAAGLAIALALQDSLSNLASGILILVNKPFVEGDYIKVGTEEGVVKSVRIFTTQIETYDKKVITLPNKSIVNGNVINYTSSPLRRVDISFCVPYGTDQQYVKQVVRDAFKNNKIALKSPSLYINVDKYDEHGLLFAFRIWGKSEDYWDLYEDAYTKLTDALYNAGIVISNNQSIIRFDKDEVEGRKSFFKKATESKVVKNEENANAGKSKKEKKIKVEVVEENVNDKDDNNTVEVDEAKEVVAIPYEEQPVIESNTLTSPNSLLDAPQSKKKRKWWGRKDV